MSRTSGGTASLSIRSRKLPELHLRGAGDSTLTKTLLAVATFERGKERRHAMADSSHGCVAPTDAVAGVASIG